MLRGSVSCPESIKGDRPVRAPDQTTIPLSRNDEYVRSFNWARVEFGIPLQTSPSHPSNWWGRSVTDDRASR